MSSSLIYDSVTGLKKDTVATTSESENGENSSVTDQTESGSSLGANGEGRKTASVKKRTKKITNEEDEDAEDAPKGIWDKLVNTFSDKKILEKKKEDEKSVLLTNYKNVNSTVAATEKNGKKTAKTNETTYEKSSGGSGSSSGDSVSVNGYGDGDTYSKLKDLVLSNVDSLTNNNSEEVTETHNKVTTPDNQVTTGSTTTAKSESTPNSTTTSSSSSSTSSGVSSANLDLTAPLVTLDHSAGSYSEVINVKMSSSESGRVYYCLGLNACCTPTQWVSNNFNIAPIMVGADDGTYCLSVMAEDLSGNRSDVLKQQYTINTNLPSINVNYNSKLYIQTTEAMQVVITSRKFGLSDYSYWALNIHDNILTNTCSDIVNQYSQTTYGIGFPISFSSLTSSDQIAFSLDKSNLNYGENYIAQIVHNNAVTGETSYSCPVQKVVLEDFEFKPMNVIGRMPASNSSSITEFQGGVSSFGYFSPTPSTKKSGDGRTLSTDQTLYLESGIVNILN